MSPSLLLSFFQPWTVNSHTVSFNREQDWEHLWEFYDLFKLCGLAPAARNGNRLWPNKGGLCFQHWTAPKILPSNNGITNVCETRKRTRVVTLPYLEVILNLSFLEGSCQIRGCSSFPTPPPASPEPQKSKEDWINQPINHLQPSVWEGLAQPTRPIIRGSAETTAEQLLHTKRKVPLFVFGQGLPSKAAAGRRQMFGFPFSGGGARQGRSSLISLGSAENITVILFKPYHKELSFHCHYHFFSFLYQNIWVHVATSGLSERFASNWRRLWKEKQTDNKPDNQTGLLHSPIWYSTVSAHYLGWKIPGWSPSRVSMSVCLQSRRTPVWTQQLPAQRKLWSNHGCPCFTYPSQQAACVCVCGCGQLQTNVLNTVAAVQCTWSIIDSVTKRPPPNFHLWHVLSFSRSWWCGS